jgi:hypothetical protein
LVSQSVLVDCSAFHLKTLMRFRLEVVRGRAERSIEVIAAEWRALLDRGEVKNRAAPARTLGLSRARVTQVLGSMASSQPNGPSS